MARRTATRRSRHEYGRTSGGGGGGDSAASNTKRSSPPKRMLRHHREAFGRRLTLESEDSLLHQLCQLMETAAPDGWKKFAEHLKYGAEVIARWDRRDSRFYSVLQDYMKAKRHTWVDVATELARIFRLDAVYKIIYQLPESRDRTVLRDRILSMRICYTMEKFRSFSLPGQPWYWERLATEHLKLADAWEHNVVGQRMAWLLDTHYRVTEEELRDNSTKSRPCAAEVCLGMSHHWTKLRGDLRSLFGLESTHLLIVSIDRRMADAKYDEVSLTMRQREAIRWSGHTVVVQSSVIGELKCSELLCKLPEDAAFLAALDAQLSIESAHGTPELIEALDLPCPKSTPLEETFYCCEQVTLRRLVSGLYMIGRREVISMLTEHFGVVEEEKQFDVNYQRISSRTLRQHVSMHSPLTLRSRHKTVGPADFYTEQEMFWMCSYPQYRAKLLEDLTTASSAQVSQARCDFNAFCDLTERYSLCDPYTGDMTEKMLAEDGSRLRLTASDGGGVKRSREGRVTAKLCQSLLRSWTGPSVSENAGDLYRTCCRVWLRCGWAKVANFVGLYEMFIALRKKTDWTEICNALWACDHSTFALPFAEVAKGTSFNVVDYNRENLATSPSQSPMFPAWEWSTITQARPLYGDGGRAASRADLSFYTAA